MSRTTNQARHREVLDAATAVIRQRGLAGASLADIAAAAGISKSTLFHYFSSKEELVDRLQERLGEIARDELGAVLATPSLTAAQRLRALARVHAHHCVERMSSPVLVAFVQRWEASSGERGRQQLDARHSYEAIFENVFRAGVAAGEFRDTDPRITVRGILGTTTWIAMWYRPGFDPPLTETVDLLLDPWFAGIAA